MSKNIELLAPAGKMACLHAAVVAGANAVYLGVGDFNARRGAENFTLENLEEACDYAHLRGVKVYLTLNTAILPKEVNAVMELARQAYLRGVDAFIVQDIGVAAEVKRTIAGARLHISTQMNIHNVEGILSAAALGASRITLARELSVSEIALLCDVAHSNNMEIETFVHGAICIAYSGQCFMSSMVGGRSANRGMCAQACRLPYSLHNVALRKDLPSPGEHLLSPKDLCGVDMIPELIRAGVCSFKIEGRMKSPEYVHAVTSVYRSAFDKAIQNEPAIITKEQREHLGQAFSRGFTTAYLEGDNSNEIMSYGRPNNRGVLVGRIKDVRNGEVSLESGLDLVQGDVLEFWTSKGNFAHELDQFCTNGASYSFQVPKRANKGDRVFRVRSAAGVFHDDQFEPRLHVTGSAKLHLGEPLSLEFSVAGDAETSASATGQDVELARTRAVTSEDVREHIDRLGNLPFTLDDIDVTMDAGVSVGFSQLHKIRTRALKNLEAEILKDYKSRRLHKISVQDPAVPWKIQASSPIAKAPAHEVCALATNPANARAAKKAGATTIYVPLLNYKRGCAVNAGQSSLDVAQAGYPSKMHYALPVVNHELINGVSEKINNFDIWEYVTQGKNVLVENLGQLVCAASLGALPEVGPHLPILNSQALDTAVRLGAQAVWLSPELNMAQIASIAKSSPVPVGVTVAGSQELMVTEHCLLMSQGPCNKNCGECARRKSPHYMKDRKGYQMPVITDFLGRSHLYNAVSLDVIYAMCDLISAGVSRFLIDTTMMNTQETAAAVKRCVRAVEISANGNAVGKIEGTTSGHFFRGID